MTKQPQDVEQDEKAEQLYEEIEDRFGDVPNFFKAQGEIDPDWMELNLDRWEQIMLSEGHLDRKTRELIALSVSLVNDCEYCVAAHSTQARQAGSATEEELGEVYQIVEFFESANRIANSLDIEIDEMFQQ
jgi:uncharacterized peroxidase-related enzyme